jgi:hypothetical protein
MKNISDFIEKWEAQKDLWRRTCKDPLMYTKEDRLQASHYMQVICAILEDIKKIEDSYKSYP